MSSSSSFDPRLLAHQPTVWMELALQGSVHGRFAHSWCTLCLDIQVPRHIIQLFLARLSTHTLPARQAPQTLTGPWTTVLLHCQQGSLSLTRRPQKSSQDSQGCCYQRHVIWQKYYVQCPSQLSGGAGTFKVEMGCRKLVVHLKAKHADKEVVCLRKVEGLVGVSWEALARVVAHTASNVECQWNPEAVAELGIDKKAATDDFNADIGLGNQLMQIAAFFRFEIASWNARGLFIPT